MGKEINVTNFVFHQILYSAQICVLFFLKRPANRISGPRWQAQHQNFCRSVVVQRSDEFGVKARNNDMLGSMTDLAAKLGGSGYAEND